MAIDKKHEELVKKNKHVSLVVKQSGGKAFSDSTGIEPLDYRSFWNLQDPLDKNKSIIWKTVKGTKKQFFTEKYKNILRGWNNEIVWGIR